MKKRKFSKRVVIIMIIAIVAVSGGGLIAFGGMSGGFSGSNEKAAEITAVSLSKTDLRDTLSLSGTVFSDSTANVYSTLSYPVKEIYVKEGDRVNAGDLLAALDVSDLDFEIRQAENSYQSALINATEEERTIAESLGGSSISAESSRLSLDKAQTSYNILLEEFSQGTSSKLVSEEKNIDTAEQTLKNAKSDLELKKNEFENNKLLFEAGAISQSEFQTYENAYNNAVTDLDSAERQHRNALASYEAAKRTLETELSTAKNEVESAKLNYRNAQNSLASAQSKTATGGYSLEGQKITLEKLKAQLDDSMITAGISGVITEVNAVVGASASGILFVIEDDKNLYASISVKEYNLAKVQTGQRAIVTTDATERDALAGEVSYIAPKALDAGESTTVEFDTHVKLTEPDERVKIGMNAFVNIIVANVQDVYAVTSEAIVSGMDGKIVYAVENGVVTEVPVTTGLETATSVEISGNLRDGMLIITNPSDTSPGSVVEPRIIQTAGSVMRQGGQPGGTGSGQGLQSSEAGSGQGGQPGGTGMRQSRPAEGRPEE